MRLLPYPLCFTRYGRTKLGNRPTVWHFYLKHIFGAVARTVRTHRSTMEFWNYGISVPRYYSSMDLWHYGITVLWNYGVAVLGYYGIVVPRY